MDATAVLPSPPIGDRLIEPPGGSQLGLVDRKHRRWPDVSLRRIWHGLRHFGLTARSGTPLPRVGS
jgi:hypothetical protein